MFVKQVKRSLWMVVAAVVFCSGLFTGELVAQEESDDPAAALPPPTDLSKLTPDQWLREILEFDRLHVRMGPQGEREVIVIDVAPLEEKPLQLRPRPDQREPLKPIKFYPLLSLKPYEIGSEELEVDRQYIVKVQHFEDLLLEEGLRRLKQGEIETAFDFYHEVASNVPFWPGLNEKLEEFLYQEALQRLVANESYRALHLLRELSQRNPDYPECKDAIGRAVNNILKSLFEDQRNYVSARHYLRLLQEKYPDHSIANSWQNRFQGESRALLDQAKRYSNEGDHRQATLTALHAADMWPTLEGLEEDFAKIFNQYSILKVGVREIPKTFDPWAPDGSGDGRVARLLHVPLMDVSGVGENTVFGSRILSDGQAELEELGRHVVLRVKPGLTWSDGEKPITAHDISRSLTARINPGRTGYDAALAGVLSKISVPDVYRVEVDLRRTQLRPETNFLFNLSRSGADIAAMSSGPYRVFSYRLGSEARMQSNEFFFGGRAKVHEIVEQPYRTPKEATNALLAGDVDLLEHVHPEQLSRIKAREDLTLMRGRIPALHVLAFDFRRFEFHSRTLRRALAYAIDRKSILEQGILAGASGDGNEVTEGPFPKTSYAYDPKLKPIPYDPVLALGLASVAKTELGAQTLRFTLTYPEVAEARQACEFIKTYLRQNLNIAIDLRPRPFQELEQAIAQGQRFDLVYRILYVRDPVLDAARVLCLGQPISPDGMAMPNCASAWLRQSLQQLELATNWNVARRKLTQIQEWVSKDIAIIPLWQLNEYYAYHERLHGMQDKSLDFYQNVENWQIDPWYRTDEP